jgi:hypothetical protein
MLWALQRCFGATDFGEFSEVYDPVREKAIKENREHILKTRGEAAARRFDEEVSQSKAGSVGTQIPAAPTLPASDEPLSTDTRIFYSPKNRCTFFRC